MIMIASAVLWVPHHIYTVNHSESWNVFSGWLAQIPDAFLKRHEDNDVSNFSSASGIDSYLSVATCYGCCFYVSCLASLRPCS